jgi:hypothetical protein
MAKAAAKLILEQAEEIERLKAALDPKAEEWQHCPMAAKVAAAFSGVSEAAARCYFFGLGL